jgi:hypothetical protein
MMLGGPCSPCCASCEADIIPSQVRWELSVDGFGVPPFSGSGTVWRWATLSSFSDVVLSRNDSVAQLSTGVPGYGWTFDGGPFNGGTAHVETNRFGEVLYTVTRQQYVRASIYAIRAADAPRSFPFNVIPSQELCSGSKCWFIGGLIRVLYVTVSSSRPPFYYLDTLYAQAVGIEAVKFASNPPEFSSRSQSFFSLRDTQSNCDRVSRSPSVFTGSTLMTDRWSVVSVSTELPGQFWEPDANPWDRIYQRNSGGTREVIAGAFTWAT